MKLHFRAPVGTRIENTEPLVLQVEDRIRQIIPPGELGTVNDMIGVPTFYNLAFVQTENVAPMDAEILISLNPKHHPTAAYQRELRRVLPHDFPGSSFFFEPADIVTQVLNFGLAAPIDVQVQGNDFNASAGIARRLADAFTRIPGMADVRIAQVLEYPTFRVNVDRLRAAEVGLSQQEVAQ